MLAEKGGEVIENVVSVFASGIKGKTLWMMVGSGVVLLAVIGWGMLGGQYREESKNRLRNALEYVRRPCSRLWSWCSRLFHRRKGRVVDNDRSVS